MIERVFDRCSPNAEPPAVRLARCARTRSRQVGYPDAGRGSAVISRACGERNGGRAEVTALLEIRDPVHNFIQVTTHERRVIDSRAVQRLRQVHQLATSYLVYPGATHRRFEHSLGVMHLAGEAFDVITRPENLTDQIRELVPQVTEDHNFGYWRMVVRLAALCHDLGHLPFSHAAEHELMPEGYTHERLSMDLINSPEFSDLLDDLIPPIHPDVLAKLAVGPEKAPAGETFSNWEAILAELVVGDAFGVDRMDYLLRDSLHAGVQYGRFDHHRLLSNLRILPSAPAGEIEESTEPALGVERGGLHAAESLLLARYFMWTQVYLHPVRLMYDAHLQDFLSAWLEGGRFSVDLETHLGMTDLEVLAAMRTAAQNPAAAGHDPAKRILSRGHFRLAYERAPYDVEITLEPGEAIAAALVEKYGAEKVKKYKKSTGSGGIEFPVKGHDGSIASSTSVSAVLRAFPLINVDQVFIEPTLVQEARAWVKENKHQILTAAAESAAEQDGAES
jgi:HD superfamily phosphohydrolase